MVEGMCENGSEDNEKPVLDILIGDLESSTEPVKVTVTVLGDAHNRLNKSGNETETKDAALKPLKEDQHSEQKVRIAKGVCLSFLVRNSMAQLLWRFTCGMISLSFAIPVIHECCRLHHGSSLSRQ